ncbi:glutaredoxin domain-containing protein [Peptostreptococcus sp. D1]|uniref:glutaredoxin domain-containing protein n=1 Tax=Peptostreptococcus sp. D1 TaxID=72304 RepID=UPI0008EA2797|nr:glutaredoxin domain-containing protein [Peptostreptococcus sp. D1]SFE66574.1 Glutaredoxin-related protein [Peptostreptococcus sp. D1]
MKKLYGSYLCPDCLPAIEFLENNNIDFEFVNITDSISSLKEFLYLRDNEAAFDNIKKENFVGIPCLVDNGKIYFQEEILNNEL